MEINVHDKEKYVSVWLTKEEAADETLHDKLTPFCDRWKRKKYRVVIFKSGDNDLICQTKELISHMIKVNVEHEQSSV